MSSSRSKCTFWMQYAAIYFVLIATYVMASIPTSSATATQTDAQHLPIRQKGQQQSHKGANPKSELKHSREFDLHNPQNKDNEDDIDLAIHLVFLPHLLDFNELPIGKPSSQVVTIFNRHPNRSVNLISISGLAADFYSSFFEDKLIKPSANTTFTVVFLPRQPGEIISSLHIHSTFGVSQYMLKGSGIDCLFRVNALIGLRAPFNATLTPEINVYNPYAVPLQIVEVFSSGGQFKLELPNGDPEAPRGMWEIPAYNTRSVIRVRFRATSSGTHKAFVRILVSAKLADINNIELVVPIEVDITNQRGVYAEHPYVNFGKGGRLDPPKKIVFKLLNSGQEAVSIQSYVVEGNNDLDKAVTLRVNSRDYNKGTGEEDLTKIHMISATIDWTKLKVQQYIRGHISIRTLLSNHELAEHRIPIVGEVIPGSIFYNENQTQFPTTGKMVKTTKGFTLRNDFEVALAITNVSLPEDTAKYFRASSFEATILQPGEESLLFRITQLAAATKRPITRTLHLHTNASTYDISLSSYNGLLRRIVPVDETTQDGVGSDEEIINYGTLPLSTVTDTVVAFVNDSPLPITIHNWTATISEAASIFVILRGCGQLTMNNLKFCYSIKPHEWMLFQVSVLSNAIGTFAGQLALQTDYEELVTPVRFSTAVGRLQFSATMLDVHRCFPGGLCSVNLTAYSSFAQPMSVKEILVNVTGITYDYSNSDFPSIVPNELTHIGQLQFSPKSLCGEECYLDFPDRWAPSVISNNCKNHHPDLLHSKLEAFRGMRTSFSSITFRVQTNHVRRYDFNGSASIIWPKLIAISGPIEFPTYQVGEEVLKVIEVTNPTDQPIRLYYMLHDVARHGSAMTYPPEVMTLCWDCFLSRESVFSLVEMDDPKHTRLQYILPRTTQKLTVRFFTKNAGSYANLLYIRNNFTILEALWLTAKAAAHQFKFGNRRPGSETPLMFELSEKHYRDCKRQVEHLTDAPVIVSAKRTFTAKNTGDVPIDIYGMYIEGMRCEGYGFRISNCWNFRLPPESSKKIEIIFTPDFTLARIDHILSIETSLHYAINYTLSSMVPSSALSVCGKALKRPPWEYQMRCIAFGVLLISFFLVLLAAFFDSDKVLKDHVLNISKDKGPMEPTLDLRQIGMRFEDTKSSPPPPAIMTNAQSHFSGSKGNSKTLSYLRKRSSSKRVEAEPSILRPKTWANVFVRKFAPIKSDVKFRDISPPPMSNRFSDVKKEPTKRQLLKEVVAMMDASNGKPIEDDSSSTTTECSSLSNDLLSKKSPTIYRKKQLPNAQSIVSPIPPVSSTEIHPKAKGKNAVKKTKSLPPQPVIKEVTSDVTPAITIPSQKILKSLPQKLSNGKSDNRTTNHSLLEPHSKRPIEQTNASFTANKPKETNENHNHNISINSLSSDLDKTHNSLNQRKYGKTPGRERRKEAPIIPVTRRQNLTKMTDKPFKGTAFAFSSPLVATPIPAISPDVASAKTTANSIWDSSKTSFSTIVAQVPESNFGNNVAQSIFSLGNDKKMPPVIKSPTTTNQTEYASPITSTADCISPMNFSMPSTKFSSVNGQTIFDYSKLKDVQDFAGRSCEKHIPIKPERPALELLEDSGEEILPPLPHYQVIDLGPIGTRKSPSNTPTWELLPSIQKPLAMPANGSENHNSYFSDTFPQYANSFIDHSDMGSPIATNDTNDSRGLSGLFENAYGPSTSDKGNVWETSWLGQLEHQQSTLSSMNNNGYNYGSQQHQHQSHNYGLHLPPMSQDHFGQANQASNAFSDPSTLWGSTFATVPVTSTTWNAPSGLIRPPPGLERQSIPNRLFNQQQASDADGRNGVLPSHRNYNNGNIIASNNSNAAFDTFNSLSSIWRADPWNASNPTLATSAINHNQDNPTTESTENNKSQK